jgi:hypothetical protein
VVKYLGNKYYVGGSTVQVTEHSETLFQEGIEKV